MHGAVLFVLLFTSWQLGLARLLPEDPGKVEHIYDGVSWEPPDPDMIYFAARDPVRADLLVVGDSRISHGIVERVFEEAGLGTTILLWGQGAQLIDELQLVRTFGPRRLLVHLDPTAVYVEVAPWALDVWAHRNDPQAETLTPSLIDTTLDDWLRGLRDEHLATLNTRAWHSNWFYELDPTAHDSILRKRLRRETREERFAQLEPLEQELAGLIRDGWQITCFRLPVSPSLQEIENAAFPGQRFEKLCRSLGVAYLDHHGDPYETTDGSHLSLRSAREISATLARELRRVAAREGRAKVR